MVLVFTPTRELMQQTKVFIWSVEGFKIIIVVGGTNIYDQRLELRGGV
jgi:ATP-dependent RNA helicase DDX5/DBP2